MTKITLKNAVISEAHRLGFQLVGVTTPEPPPHLEVFERWLAAGYHAGMKWLDTDRNRQRRADPRIILPECKSILVLGIAYPPSPVSMAPPGESRIASYAWGDDYHEVLPPRLKAIVSFIESRIGKSVPNRWYTDTGPILEREMAQRAGLGWIGKNTCLINPKAGSYFLLAEILLGIELVLDEPFLLDHCGSCNRCVEACPTECILPDRTIDANRCISYLTIEEKEALPLDLRSQIGNWVFGCDVCQQVCPWNLRFASPAKEPQFSASSGGPTRPMIKDLGLKPQEFNKKFQTSPLKRTKRRGYLRNVSVAIGNAAISEGVPVLTQSLYDPEPLIRSHAAWALGKIGGSQANQALKQALQSETESNVRIEIQSALSNNLPTK